MSESTGGRTSTTCFTTGCGAAGVEDATAKTMFWAVWNFGPKWGLMLPAIRGTPPPTGTEIQKPMSTDEVHAIYERSKRENPSVGDIEEGKL